MLYNNLSGYLRKKYNGKIKKICIDGGFSCPNRDGTCGYGGCIFCAERGSGEHIVAGRSIREQINDFFASPPAADGYIAYFQNFTNTYAPADVLKKRYDDALCDERIVALAIGTRPDCITPEVCELISSYSKSVDVWVELGLQTASDETARIINRGYKTEVYIKAAELLASYRIPFVTHLMIGLPGEADEHLAKTVDVVNSSRPWGVKIHSVYVCRGTVLAEMYERGEYTPISFDDYVTRAAYAVSHLSPDIVIHRLTGDCPRELLVAPLWNPKKNEVINAINGALLEQGKRQGSDYREISK